MTVLLALLAAAAYGLGDFWGGLTSRRVSAWTVALVVQTVGAVVTAAAALLVGGTPDRGDLAWALLAGFGNGVGTAALYRGLAAGRMGLVAPVSGVGAAVLPVVVGVGVGERPGVLAWIGILAALPAIWLVSRQPTGDRPAAGTLGAGLADGLADGLGDGLLAGVGFGTLFVGLSRVHPGAGLWPLTVNQAVAGLTVVGVATLAGQPWLPREPRAALGAVSGVLGAAATALFLVSSRGGHLTVAAVVISLYPAFTVLLAAGALREPIHRAQTAGLIVCGLAVVLVATG